MNLLKLEELNKLLQSRDADYTIIDDNVSLKTASAGAEHYGISLQETTPTLVLKIDDEYIAAIICGNTRIVFKKLKQALQVKNITMANPQEVFAITGVQVGEVSLINPSLKTIIDSKVLENKNCYGGCGVLGKTLCIKAQDLMRITHAYVLDFAEVRE
jgi:prolyl-tRNA editing enzyme YbaK/EbsC (Cys-tRNA(Pro) deacylase)